MIFPLPLADVWPSLTHKDQIVHVLGGSGRFCGCALQEHGISLRFYEILWENERLLPPHSPVYHVVYAKEGEKLHETWREMKRKPAVQACTAGLAGLERYSAEII